MDAPGHPEQRNPHEGDASPPPTGGEPSHAPERSPPLVPASPPESGVSHPPASPTPPESAEPTSSTETDAQREAFLAALYAPEPEPLESDAEEDTPFPLAAAAQGDAGPVADPWAHRRGEPRVFALLWALYVLIAVAGSILWLARLPVVSTTSYNPAARTLIIVIAAGITVLWPMTRLSQAAPDNRPLASVLADVLVLLIPVQMVVWPMMVLAGWPLDVVGAIAGLLSAWALVTGGVLAVAFAARPKSPDQLPGPGGAARSAWMIVCLGLTLAAPAVLALEPLRGAGSWSWLHACSPFTAVFAFTGDGWTGPTAPIQNWHWAGLLLTLALALALWAAALARLGAGSARGRRLH